MKNSAAYDSISDAYTKLVKTDPQKRFVQYPSALNLLGDVTGLRVLDVGCGSGAFTREIAHKAAEVVGYDISAEQIANAMKQQENEQTEVRYIVSGPQEFNSTAKFDKAVSVLVLHYSPNDEYLQEFFRSTCDALKENGTFVCILANPNFKRVGTAMYNRCFRRIGNGRMVVDFLNKDGDVSCSAEYSDFSAEDYEKAAISGGFSKVEWKALKVEKLGTEELGEEYWNGFEEDCLYIGFIAYK